MFTLAIIAVVLGLVLILVMGGAAVILDPLIAILIIVGIVKLIGKIRTKKLFLSC